MNSITKEFDTTALNVKGISLTKGGVNIVDDVTFSVGFGHVLAVIGPSGAGKSALFRCVAGVEQITSGEIELKHQDSETIYRLHVNRSKTWPHVAMMFQSLAIIPHLSIMQNVCFPFYMMPEINEIELRAKALLQRLGLSLILDKRASMCSLGEQQRASFARSIMSRAHIVILDEPTASVDPARSQIISEVILEESQRGRAFIISSHFLGFLKRTCQSFIYVEGGRIVEAGQLDAISKTQHDEVRKFVEFSVL